MPKRKNEIKFEILERISVKDFTDSLESAFSDQKKIVKLQVVDHEHVQPFTIALNVTSFQYRDNTGENIELMGDVYDMPNMHEKKFVGHCWLTPNRLYNFGHFHVFDV